MFKFLTEMFTGKKKKATEIRNLKQEIQRTVKECHDAAKRGDSQASLRLKAFEETITEKSVRLTGLPKPPTTIIPGGLKCAIMLLGALMLSVLGCSSENTVKDPDRVVVDYNRQMWLQVQVIASGISSDAPDAAAALAALTADGLTASNHLIETWGPPKVAPPPYSTANLKLAIDQSKAAHKSIWLHPMALLGYGAMALLTGLKVAGSFFPGIGTFISSALGQGVEALGSALVNVTHKAEDHPNDTIHVSDIKAEVAIARESPAVEALLARLHLDKLADNLLGPTLPKPPAVAVVAPAPAPSA